MVIPVAKPRAGGDILWRSRRAKKKGRRRCDGPVFQPRSCPRYGSDSCAFFQAFSYSPNALLALFFPSEVARASPA